MYRTLEVFIIVSQAYRKLYRAKHNRISAELVVPFLCPFPVKNVPSSQRQIARYQRAEGHHQTRLSHRDSGAKFLHGEGEERAGCPRIPHAHIIARGARAISPCAQHKMTGRHRIVYTTAQTRMYDQKN